MTEEEDLENYDEMIKNVVYKRLKHILTATEYSIDAVRNHIKKTTGLRKLSMSIEDLEQDLQENLCKIEHTSIFLKSYLKIKGKDTQDELN